MHRGGGAWHFANERALFATLPQANTVFDQHEFPAAVALYLGLPDPLIVDTVAASRGNLSHFRDAGMREALRPLDNWGNHLSMYVGRGHGRTVYHNDVQRELSSLAQAVGHRVRETPQDVFLSAITASAREEYLQQIRTNRDRGDFRGGVVPDLFDPISKQMYDVKTTGFKQDAYIGRRSAVDEKAATVPVPAEGSNGRRGIQQHPGRRNRADRSNASYHASGRVLLGRRLRRSQQGSCDLPECAGR